MITRRSLLSLGAVGTAGILTACSSDKPSDSSASGAPETASGAADSTSDRKSTRLNSSHLR